MIKEFLIYHFKYNVKRNKENNEVAWFLSAGFQALAIAFKIAAIIVVTLAYTEINLIQFKNPNYIILGIPWLVMFIIIYFNKSLKRNVKKEIYKPIKQKTRIIFWVYYIVSVAMYLLSIKYFRHIIY